MITINQIKCDDGIFIRYTKRSDDVFKSAEHTLKCYEKADPGFYEALAALNIHACKLCELPESYLGRLSLSQVDFKYKNDGNETAILRVNMLLLESDIGDKIQLKTPEKLVSPFRTDQEGSHCKQYMSKAMEGDLEVVKNEAIFYIRGKRAQMSLLETA